MKKIIHLNETDLKKIIANTMNEMRCEDRPVNDSDFENLDTDYEPTAHEENNWQYLKNNGFGSNNSQDDGSLLDKFMGIWNGMNGTQKQMIIRIALKILTKGRVRF